jgi:tetratricopeptide (TPR) repeat protein
MRRAAHILGLVLPLIAATSSESWASTEGEIIPKRLAVMPLRIIPTNATEIFTPATAYSNVAMARRVAMTLSKQPEFTTFAWSEIRTRLEKKQGFSDALQLTEANISLGVDQYRNLRVEEAVHTLERARILLHEKLIDLHSPELAAKLYLHLGICLVEQNKIDQARIAFARMFYYQPEQRFERGFHPRKVEETLVSAISDLNNSLPIGAPGMEIRFLNRLKSKGKLDQVVTLVMRGTTNSEVELRIYDLNRGMATQFQRIPRKGPDDLDANTLDRFASRYVACGVFERSAPSTYQQRYRTSFIETHGGYHTYARTPTRDIFHSMSIGLRAGKGVAKNIAFFSDLSLLTSFQDRNRDLANRLVSLRAVAGVEYRAHWRRLTFFFSPGIEANLLPDFTVYTSANCKFFGADHPLCLSKNIKKMKSEVLMGLNGGLGMRYHPTKSLFFSLRVSASVYLLPVDENKKLDFPLTAMLGLGFNL